MIDLTPLKPYIVEDNSDYDHMADIMIEDKGFDDWFNNHIQCWCNCCFIGPSGHRLIQTNDKRYNYEITTVIHAIEKHAVDKDFYYNELINRHFSNLEFERINGYDYDPYSTTKKKPTTSRKKGKQTSLDFGDKPKKETAADRKLKAHAAKISMFKLSIKPVNNENNSL